MKKDITLPFLFALLFFTFSNNTFAQSFGIHLNTDEAQKGYVLMEKFVDGTWLVDNCGRVVNEWPNVGNSENHPKLLPNGNLMFQSNTAITELDWDGNPVNWVEVPFGTLRLAYEVIKMPNGNYLCLGRRLLTEGQFIDMGFEMGGINTPSRIDVVVEFDYESGDIVWEWNLSDHVIQERTDTLNNYGIVADHPELLDMDAISTYDWTFTESFMINGMDYNPELDQIALSVRKMNEIIIIDHSTTTAEAAGHSGGNSGKGGDVLYRWGNPQNYGQGDESDHFLYFQHNPKWITEGPHAGKMTCYNNGLGRPTGELYSEIPIIDTGVDANGNYTLPTGQAYPPTAPEFVWSEPINSPYFFSGYTSGAQLMPNGNIFITEGFEGRLLELDTVGNLVWSYQVPDAYYIFRTEKYPLDYPAFADKDLIPGDTVNGANSIYECELFVDTMTSNLTEIVSLDFSIEYLTNRDITVINNTNNSFSYALIDGQGRQQLYGESQNGRQSISLANVDSGLYVLIATDEKTGKRIAEKMILR